MDSNPTYFLRLEVVKHDRTKPEGEDIVLYFRNSISTYDENTVRDAFHKIGWLMFPVIEAIHQEITRGFERS